VTRLMLGYQRNTAQAYKKYAKECAKRMTNNTLRYRLIHYINKELHQYYRQQQMIAPCVRLVVAGVTLPLLQREKAGMRGNIPA